MPVKARVERLRIAVT